MKQNNKRNSYHTSGRKEINYSSKRVTRTVVETETLSNRDEDETKSSITIQKNTKRYSYHFEERKNKPFVPRCLSKDYKSEGRYIRNRVSYSKSQFKTDKRSSSKRNDSGDVSKYAKSHKPHIPRNVEDYPLEPFTISYSISSDSEKTFNLKIESIRRYWCVYNHIFHKGFFRHKPISLKFLRENDETELSDNTHLEKLDFVLREDSFRMSGSGIIPDYILQFVGCNTDDEIVGFKIRNIVDDTKTGDITCGWKFRIYFRTDESNKFEPNEKIIEELKPFFLRE